MAAADGAAGQSRQARSIEWPGTGARLLVLAVSMAIGAMLGIRGLTPPEPAPADSDWFSAIRAANTARAVLGDRPRPVGSESNAQAVARLVDLLRARGLTVETSEAKVRAGGREVTLRNVLARKTGAMPGPAVLMCAHHDSAANAPGASDDGFGVAIMLEAAGALGSSSWPGRDVVLLFTDGEEAGLLGAKHFVNNHPWHTSIGVVVNVDNRGNAGPSILHEVCGNSADVLQSCSTALAPVVGSSLYSEIASRMPNSSDLSVFRDAGMSGMNFALIGGHEHYHAPSDDWSTASLASLQHEGEAALLAMQALAMHRADTPKPDGRAVYQDIAGRMLAWWPARAGATASAACVAGIAALGWFAARRARVRPRDVAFGWLGAALRFVVAGTTAWVIMWLTGLLGLHGMQAATDAMPDAALADRYRAAFWPSHGVMLSAAALVAGLGCAILASWPLLRRHDPMCGFIGAWGALTVFTSMLAVFVPGASAPLLPISLTVALALAAGVLALEGRERIGMLLPIAAAGFLCGLLLMPIEAISWIGVGLSMPEFTAIRCAVLALVLLPAITPTATTR
jgi:hypothetical protein